MAVGRIDVPARFDLATPTSTAKPTTSRGRRTRQRLLDAAAVVFVRDGYLDTKIATIAQEANVATGTFYNYFDTKEDIFTDIMKVMIAQLFAAAFVPAGAHSAPMARIEAATRAYVRACREHAGLLGILEQVATFNTDFRELRVHIRRSFRNRTVRGIQRMQREGIVDPDISASVAAEALTSMVSNFCYVWLVLGEAYDEEEAVRTLTTIWSRGLGFDCYTPKPD